MTTGADFGFEYSEYAVIVRAMDAFPRQSGLRMFAKDTLMGLFSGTGELARAHRREAMAAGVLSVTLEFRTFPLGSHDEKLACMESAGPDSE